MLDERGFGAAPPNVGGAAQDELAGAGSGSLRAMLNGRRA